MTNNEPPLAEVAIAWKELKGKRYLNFNFKGDFSEGEATSAILKWKIEQESAASAEKVSLIWNCIQMQKYSAKAAKLWKNALMEMSPGIDEIWLVSTNTFIKMGARTVTFLLPVNFKVVGSEDEIT